MKSGWMKIWASRELVNQPYSEFAKDTCGKVGQQDKFEMRLVGQQGAFQIYLKQVIKVWLPGDATITVTGGPPLIMSA